MKSVVLLLLAIAANAAVLPHTPKQLSRIPIQDTETLEVIKPKSVEKLTPKLAPNAIRERIRWGPFDLTAVDPEQAHNVTIDSEADDFVQILDGICTDCMVIYGSASLTYEDNTATGIGTGVYNHHVFIGAVGKKSKPFFTCKNPTTATAVPTSTPTSGHEHLKSMASGVAVELFHSGHDGSAVDYWDATGNILSGSYVGPNDIPIHSSTWVNYKEYKQQVYLTAEYEYVKGKPAGYVDSGIGIVSVMGCGLGEQEYYPPVNQSSSVLSPEYVVTAPGSVFNSMAHLHDGGVSVHLFINEQLACTSSAVYGGNLDSTEIDGVTWETITSYTRCDAATQLKVGDILQIESLYDTRLHPMRPGAHDHEMSGEAMGIMTTIFAPDQS